MIREKISLRTNDSFRERLLRRETAAEKRAFDLLNHFWLIVQKQKIVYASGSEKYYVDLWLPAYKIGIELDGGVHNSRGSYDLKRDLSIMDMGAQIVLVRFTNEDIFQRQDYFLKAISDLLVQRTKYQNYFEDGRFLLDKQDRILEGKDLGEWGVLYNRDAVQPIVVKNKYAFRVNRWGCTLDGFILQ